MATITTTGNIENTSGKVIGTFNVRFTYTIDKTSYPNRAILKFTKIEYKDNYASSISTAGTEDFYYYSSQTATSRTKTSISYSGYECEKGVWKTIWTGTKTITAYKKTTTTTVYLSSGSGAEISIPAATSYNVTYSASGASNVPATQKKYYGFSLSLSSSRPTKTGYTFVNWKSNESTSKYYLPGASYTVNAAVTMTAQWNANKYTVIYSVNGGTGSVANQTKTYDIALNFRDG